METILLTIILLVGLAILYFQIKSKPKQEENVTEKIMLMLARSLKDEYKLSNLCLAGGVALNCVANGKILEEKERQRKIDEQK